MNQQEAERLTRRAKALRAKAVYVSDTGERVPPAEKRALERKAKELEERVRTEYQPATAKRSAWTTGPQHYPHQQPQKESKAWVYEQGEDYLNAYFNGTAPEEDIVEEGYRYAPDEEDYS